MLKVVLLVSLAVCMVFGLGDFNGFDTDTDSLDKWTAEDYFFFKAVLEMQSLVEYLNGCVTNKNAEDILNYIMGSNVVQANDLQSILIGEANDCLTPDNSQTILDILISEESECKVRWVRNPDQC